MTNELPMAKSKSVAAHFHGVWSFELGHSLVIRASSLGISRVRADESCHMSLATFK
jgi:hypothetical protein